MVVVGLVVLLAAAALTTGRVAGFQNYAGLQRPINSVCSAVSANAAVLVLGESNLPIVLPGASAAGCGSVPASGAPPGAGVPEIAAGWRAQGRELVAAATGSPALQQAGFVPVARGGRSCAGPAPGPA